MVEWSDEMALYQTPKLTIGSSPILEPRLKSKTARSSSVYRASGVRGRLVTDHLDPSLAIEADSRLRNPSSDRHLSTSELVPESTASPMHPTLVLPSGNEGLILAQPMRGFASIVHRKGLAMVRLK
jgi:hypothetical protein